MHSTHTLNVHPKFLSDVDLSVNFPASDYYIKEGPICAVDGSVNFEKPRNL
jgi:hypothetical protein